VFRYNADNDDVDDDDDDDDDGTDQWYLSEYIRASVVCRICLQLLGMEAIMEL